MPSALRALESKFCLIFNLAQFIPDVRDEYYYTDVSMGATRGFAVEMHTILRAPSYLHLSTSDMLSQSHNQ